MLKLISEGLKRAGHNSLVVLQPKVNILSPKLDCDEIVEPDNSISILKNLEVIVDDKEIDLVFPIAPDEILGKIVKELNSQGIKTISSTHEAINIAGDKWKIYQILKKSRIRTPKTFLLKKGTTIEEVKSRFDYPLIIKKRKGTACEGLFEINNESELTIFMNKKNLSSGNYLIQEFIHGENASVTLFSNGKKSIAVSLNKQEVKLSNSNSSYLGGEVPFDHPSKEEAFKLAYKAIDLIPGLKGCLGIDIILAENPYVIEINPRVTTSMIVLEKASNLNVADAALNSTSGYLPEIPNFHRKIQFRKNLEERKIEFRDVK